MASQHCGFIGPTQNMLQFNLAGTFGAGERDTQTMFPKATYQTQQSLSEMLSRYASFPHFAYSSSNPYPNLSTHLPVLLPPFAMVRRRSSRLNSDTASGYSSPKKDEPQPLVDTEQSVPVLSKPSSVRPSRLPSNDVTRKAPLKGTFRASELPPPNAGRKFPKPKQQRSRTRKTDTISSDNPILNRLRSAVVKRSGKQKRTPLYDEVEEEEESDDEAEAPATAETQERVENVDKGVTENDETEDDNETEDALTSPENSGDSAARRPMYDYIVPLELESLHKALGSDSWTEYIFLAESLWLNKITADEFEKRSKPIFRTHDDHTRKKIHRIVTRRMIEPQVKKLGVVPVVVV